MASYRIGTSGWHYDHWRDSFYPTGLPKTRWLEYYAARFPTVELNASFYRLPSETAFAVWRDTSPPGFIFAVKGSRLITHYRRLRNVEDALTRFLTRARLLGNRLGPILWQLPPNQPLDLERLSTFLRLLPTDLRYAVEFRDPAWFEERVYEVLRQNNVALCIADLPGLACPIVRTADIAYVRFHGSQAKYASRYSRDELQAWAERLETLGADVQTIYVYFNNDAHAFAVDNARELTNLLSGSAVPLLEGQQLGQCRDSGAAEPYL